jgi:cytochrome P450
VTSTVDPYAPEVVADPFGAYSALRMDPLVAHVTQRELWVLSRFDDVVAAAGDSSRFSSAETNGYARRSLQVLVGTDPPKHTRLRRLSAGALSAHRQESLISRVEEIVAERVESFAPAGRRAAVAGFAEPLACAVFAHVLGLDPDLLASRRAGLGLRPDPRRAWMAFLAEAVAARRELPRDDLISTLLQPDADGDRLTDKELIALLGLLLAAGADTTRDLLANLLFELAQDPDQWCRLVADPSLIESAVEEGLRYTSPIQAMFRTTTCDVDVDAARIPQGARVMLLFGSADRDERRWPDADRFDVCRYAHGLARGGAHIAFGAGPHACPGAHLARRIARRALSELRLRDARLELDGPVIRGRNPCFRSILSLPLHVRIGGVQ